MKKKLLVATALIVLMAMVVSVLVGCDEIFTRNDERDMTQVVARVKYAGMSYDIYKYELKASYDSYAYAYYTYYGMSYEAIANYILQSLAQQKLLVLYAKEQVTKKLYEDGLRKDDKIPADIAELLSNAEINKAYEDANESLLNSLKSIVEEQVTEDHYNSATSEPAEDEEDENVEITDPVRVTFETNGASAIEKQRIQKGKKATEPTEPTKDGYVFYGWYENDKFEGEEFDFDTQINANMTLYARWEEYTAPRAVMPEEEEEDDYDPDNWDFDKKDIAPAFFSDEYIATIYDEFKEEDFVDNIELNEGETLEEVLGSYINDGLDQLKSNLMKNLYRDNVDSCYAYYINSQMESLLTTRLERMIGQDVTVTDDEIMAEFKRVVQENKESFAMSDSAYASALGSSLSSTYYNPLKDGGNYGFVTNILLRLDDDDLKTLTDLYSENPSKKASVTIQRNILLSKMQVKVSNPAYKEDAVVEKDGEELEFRDAMVEGRKDYFGLDKTEYQHEGGNNYEKIVEFGKKLGDAGEELDEYEIRFNATEHPAMPYLLDSVPAFDLDGKVGIIHQIYNSFEEVKAAGLEPVEEIYWLRKLAQTWAYLVGDDTGAVTDSSNNNGLGYLITPEGEDSSYLEDFTTYARNLIKEGTGAYSVGNVTADTFVGAEEDGDGTLAGNNVAFVAADSFIKSGSTSNAYAGVFVLLNTYTVWDSEFYKSYTGGSADLPENRVLPLNDYLIELGKDKEDSKTIYDVIKENIETAKKTEAYNLDINTFGNAHMEEGIEYFEKAYRSLWK